MKKKNLLKIYALLWSLLLCSSSVFAQHQCSSNEVVDFDQDAFKKFKNTSLLLKNTADSIPLNVTVVRRTDGSGGVDEQAFLDQLALTNTQLAPSNSVLYICGGINYIDDNDYYNMTDIKYFELIGLVAEADMANVYIINNFGCFAGFGSTVTVDHGCATSNILTHEFGHYFGLNHTFGPGSGNNLTEELVDGSNCTTTGDQFCDTPADPKLTGDVDYSTCTYTGTATDANGDVYQPSVRNFMSYYNLCANEFTPEQYAFMEFFKAQNITGLSCSNNTSDGYCDSNGSSPWQEWIQNVKLTNSNNTQVILDHTSAKEGYANFTDQVATVPRGSNLTLDVTTGYSWASYNEYISVWIDYDQDGEFQSSNENGPFPQQSELVYSGILPAPANGTLSGQLTGQITIPGLVFLGPTRMRISMKRGDFTEPCSFFVEGEVEDYTIEILDQIDCTGDITFFNQADVDAFGPCTVFDGSIDIIGFDILNLDALLGLTEITGDLNISAAALTNLDGLSNLERVGGFLSMNGNVLEDISGLSNLVEIEEGLAISSMPNLMTLDGLQNLEILRSLILSGLPGLSTLDELDNLQELSGFITLIGLPNLTSLSGLTNASKSNVSSLEINGLPLIESLDGLEGITTIDGDLFMIFNDALTDLTALSSLTTVSGNITFASNDGPINLDGFENITTLDGNLAIVQNPNLSDCCSVLNIINAGGGNATVDIYGNLSNCNSQQEIITSCATGPSCAGNITLSSQAEVDAFGPCTTYDGDIKIQGTSITNINTFAGLKTINGKFEINNTSIWNVAGLSDLETVNGNFILVENANLNNISALSNLTTTDNLVLANLPQLTSLDGLQNLTDIGNKNINITGVAITNVDELSGIASTQEIAIGSNPNLTNIDGLLNIMKSNLNNLEITSNPQLMNLDGLSGISNIDREFLIVGNEQLTDITGISSLMTIGESLVVFDNDALSSLEGLENLSSLGALATGFDPLVLVISENAILSDCCIVFPLLDSDSFTGDVGISGNLVGCNSELEILNTCTDVPSCSGDITLSTQAEVDAFGPCTTYDGDISIQGNDITNLASFAGLETINGKLDIINTSLVDVAGLSDLEIIDGVLFFLSNPNMTTISTLSNLTSVVSLVFDGVPNLTSLNGLQNLTNIASGVINITDVGISNLDELSNIDKLEDLVIGSNPNLMNIDGLTDVVKTNLSSIDVFQNGELLNLNGLAGVTTVDLSVYLLNNDKLESIAGLSSLTTIGNELFIVSNDLLTSLNGLENVSSIALSGNAFATIELFENAKLSDCCALFPFLDSGNYEESEIFISNNPLGCNSIQAILSSCSTQSGEYCDARGTSPWQEWIQNINISNPEQTITYLDHTSLKEGYADFTNQIARLQKSTTGFSIEHRFEATAAYSWASYDEYVTAWIDYNQNGIFESSELMFSESIQGVPNGTGSGSEWDTFIIPADALNGPTRMRVIMQRGAYNYDPCSEFTLGEVEDYTIIIEDADPSTGITIDCQDEINILIPPNGNSPQDVCPGVTPLPMVTSTCVDDYIVPTLLNYTIIDGNFNVSNPGGNCGPFLINGYGTIELEVEFNDDCGNTASCTYIATIGLLPHQYGFTTCPNTDGVVLTAAEGASGAIVDFPDLGYEQTNCPDGTADPIIGLLYGQESGSFFEIGTTDIGVQAYSCYNFATQCFFSVTVLPFEGGGEYCVVKADRPWEEWISNVKLEGYITTIDNASGKCDDICGYSDFTDIIGVSLPGAPIEVTLTPGLSWSGHDADLYWSIWIDYNQDGDFTDADETVFQAYGGSDVVRGTIDVPSSVAYNNTRLRIAAKKRSYATPCENFDRGEVEDYTIGFVINEDFSQAAPADLYFNALKNGRTALLNWTRTTEFDNDYFELERSFDGTNFETIHNVDRTQEVATTYRFTDNHPQSGINYYRLKAVFVDGNIAYSETRTVAFEMAIEDITIFPNPATDELFIDLKTLVGETAELHIYNQLGQPLEQLQITDFANAPVRIDLQEYLSGVYHVVIKVDHQKLITRKFVISKL